MKLESVFLFVISFLFVPTESVINGSFVAIKDAPYYVGIGYVRNDYFVAQCGGTIISEYWIVTAAHCITFSYTTNLIAVTAGASSKRPFGMHYIIEKIIVPGNYERLNFDTVSHDIALIKLKTPISFDEFRQPIKIATEPPRVGDTVLLSGQGDQGKARGAAVVLKSVELTIVDQEVCKRLLTPWFLTDSVFCAGNSIKSACYGDSGGPVVLDGKLAGVVSFGECEKVEKQLGAYTRVHMFYDWIVDHTGLKF